MFTDYLDDVSGVYADPNDLISQRGATSALLADMSANPRSGKRAGSAGNGKKNDMYYFAGVGVQYYFGRFDVPNFYGKNLQGRQRVLPALCPCIKLNEPIFMQKRVFPFILLALGAL